MSRHTEPLDGGLWTAADPAMLQEGQLTLMQNAVYLPGSRALQRARGRSEFGAVSSVGVAVVGLRDLVFDNGNRYLIAVASSSALSATVGDTGTFGSLTSLPGVPTSLEAVHYRNRFYLLNGLTQALTATSVNSQNVAYLSATAATALNVRQHGMVAMTDAPTVTASAVTFSQTVTGYYEYWTTEVATSQQDGADFRMEGTFVGTPTTIFVSSTGMSPIVYRPEVKNTAAATHWRIYRSPKKDKASDKKFPAGFAISPDISLAATSMIDSQVVTNTGFVFPANMNGVSDGATVWADFANAARLSAADGSFASATSIGIVSRKNQGVYGFNFGGFVGPVQGVEVELVARVNTGTSQVGVSLVRKRQSDGGVVPSSVGNNWWDQAIRDSITKRNMASKSFTVTTSAASAFLGGQTDRWFADDNPRPLADSDFGTDFMVLVGFSDTTTTTLEVDYVRTKVYYGGSIDSVTVFPTVVYTFGDVAAQVGKNGPPPGANTGDLFEDQLVLNDTANPAMIRWSYPGDPEAFPPTYYLDFETRENDRVRLAKVVNSVLVVALDSSIWRINFLPSERDSSFDRGKATAPISRTYGCVNPMCAATFSMDNSPEILAFVSNSGIHGTDGYSFDTYTDGLDWRDIISATSTSTPICLINDRERQELLFYFRNDALGNETYQCLHLSYAKEHLVNGKPKVSGPVHMRNFDSVGSGYASLESAWSLQRSNGATDVVLGYGGASAAAGAGKVYRETGTTIPSNDSTVKWSSRRMYLAGFGNEWEGQEIYGYCGSYTGSPVITYTAQNTKTNDAGPTAVYSKSVTLGGQKLHKVSPRFMFEGMQLTAQVTASAYSQESFIIEGEGWGEEDSGR